MISTITTATVSTVTTAAMVGSIALIGILVLFALLVQKELAVSSSSESMKRLSRVLNIGIIPLVITFLMIAAINIIKILNL